MYPYIIYGIIHRLQPDHIHYAGQTRVGLDKRRRGHISAARRGATVPSSVWIRENLDDVEFVILHEVERPEDLNDLEIEVISHLWSIGQAELNMLPGGQGAPSDWVPSDELKQRWSEQRRYGNIGTCKVSTEEVLEIRRLSADGFPDRELSTLFDIGVQGVGHILRGESWGYLPWEEGTQPRNSPSRAVITEEEWTEVYESLARAETVTSISKRMNISRGRIARQLRARPDKVAEYGLDSPQVKEARKRAKYALTSLNLRGQKSPEAGMTDETARKIKEYLFRGYSQSDIAQYFEVSKNAVNLMSSNASWRHVPWPIGPRPKPKGKKRIWMDEHWS